LKAVTAEGNQINIADVKTLPVDDLGIGKILTLRLLNDKGEEVSKT
jgi:hypothetical protein